MENIQQSAREPWNKGKLVGQKTPLKLKEIWAIRIRLQIARRCRELALFNLAIDSKLRACDLIQLRVRDVCHGQSMASRALILHQKTGRPVQFEITEPARTALTAWIANSKLKPEDFLFPSRIHDSPSPPVNTLGSSILGFCNSDWIRPTTARILSGVRRRH
jgi:integrase